MDEIKYHLSLFPPRLRSILESFRAWDQICEIRLRNGAPLSLTDQNGNVTLNDHGIPCSVTQGVTCTSEDLSYLLGAFCGGSVYRYFDRMKNGFVVDDYGWRMGISTLPEKSKVFLPQQILGINLRIPRQIPFAAEPVIRRIRKEGLFSLLIFSPPGEGKTTFLRSLAAMLSLGSSGLAAVKVAVVDEKSELFPPQMRIKAGLIDVLPSYEKGEGITLATKLFSPEVIACDEIGSMQETEAILNAGSGGCFVMATAHARDLREAKRLPHLAKLIDSGRFRYGLFLKKMGNEKVHLDLQWEDLS